MGSRGSGPVAATRKSRQDSGSRLQRPVSPFATGSRAGAMAACHELAPTSRSPRSSSCPVAPRVRSSPTGPRLSRQHRGRAPAGMRRSRMEGRQCPLRRDTALSAPLVRTWSWEPTVRTGRQGSGGCAPWDTWGRTAVTPRKRGLMSCRPRVSLRAYCPARRLPASVPPSAVCEPAWVPVTNQHGPGGVFSRFRRLEVPDQSPGRVSSC